MATSLPIIMAFEYDPKASNELTFLNPSELFDFEDINNGDSRDIFEEDQQTSELKKKNVKIINESKKGKDKDADTSKQLLKQIQQKDISKGEMESLKEDLQFLLLD